jgi:hypothetical protein
MWSKNRCNTFEGEFFNSLRSQPVDVEIRQGKKVSQLELPAGRADFAPFRILAATQGIVWLLVSNTRPDKVNFMDAW